MPPLSPSRRISRAFHPQALGLGGFFLRFVLMPEIRFEAKKHSIARRFA